MTPPAVSRTKATRPIAIIIMVLTFTNFSPVIVAAIEKPSRMVTIFASSFWAACESLSVTPLSLRRLPNITKPSSDTEAGAIIPPSIVTAIGKIILALFVTVLVGAGILIRRSFSDVMASMTGGWIIGTSAM